MQHRRGALWTLNTAAIELIGSGLSREERASGQLWRSDARLRALLPTDDLDEPALAELSGAWPPTASPT